MHHISKAGVSKLRPVGHIRPAKLFYPARQDTINDEKMTCEKFIGLLQCNISHNNNITYDGHVNVSWLSITALQAGLTFADMMPQSEVFVNIPPC